MISASVAGLSFFAGVRLAFGAERRIPRGPLPVLYLTADPDDSTAEANADCNYWWRRAAVSEIPRPAENAPCGTMISK